MSRAPVLVACPLWGALEAGCHSGELRPEPPSLAGTCRLESADKLTPAALSPIHQTQMRTR